jgi:hypothetical protein
LNTWKLIHITNHRRENLSLISPVDGGGAGGAGAATFFPAPVDEAAPTPPGVDPVAAASLAEEVAEDDDDDDDEEEVEEEEEEEEEEVDFEGGERVISMGWGAEDGPPSAVRACPPSSPLPAVSMSPSLFQIRNSSVSTRDSCPGRRLVRILLKTSHGGGKYMRVGRDWWAVGQDVSMCPSSPHRLSGCHSLLDRTRLAHRPHKRD